MCNHTDINIIPQCGVNVKSGFIEKGWLQIISRLRFSLFSKMGTSTIPNGCEGKFKSGRRSKFKSQKIKRFYDRICTSTISSGYPIDIKNMTPENFTARIDEMEFDSKIHSIRTTVGWFEHTKPFGVDNLFVVKIIHAKLFELPTNNSKKNLRWTRRNGHHSYATSTKLSYFYNSEGPDMFYNQDPIKVHFKVMLNRIRNLEFIKSQYPKPVMDLIQRIIDTLKYHYENKIPFRFYQYQYRYEE